MATDELTSRAAEPGDLTNLVAMLADDTLGMAREAASRRVA